MPKVKTRSSYVMVACVAGLLAGCSTQARRVDCDGRMRPINAPAPVIAPTSASPVTEQSQ